MGLIIEMFRVKQIALVAILGMALVLATAAVYTQSVQAAQNNQGTPTHMTNVGRCGACNGVNPGGSLTSGSTQNSQGQNDNSQGNEAGSSGGGTPTGDGFGRGFL